MAGQDDRLPRMPDVGDQVAPGVPLPGPIDLDAVELRLDHAEHVHAGMPA